MLNKHIEVLGVAYDLLDNPILNSEEIEKVRALLEETIIGLQSICKTLQKMC